MNTKAICKILIRRRLETLHALIKEYNLVIDAKLDSTRIKLTFSLEFHRADSIPYEIKLNLSHRCAVLPCVN